MNKEVKIDEIKEDKLILSIEHQFDQNIDKRVCFLDINIGEGDDDMRMTRTIITPSRALEKEKNPRWKTFSTKEQKKIEKIIKKLERKTQFEDILIEYLRDNIQRSKSDLSPRIDNLFYTKAILQETGAVEDPNTMEEEILKKIRSEIYEMTVANPDNQ